ncbi:MAG: 3-methyl-2-oxobutanoate dehydrogenase subunit VorB [Bryobacteraceae bacterium]|nr:3-methyl-2-oxobutanoate dehydrogenase subunit VorB [Bryobacteraceae bacterium]MDW8380004.1 3-methyl-2-oxobutanoate dehydrogenase subunit VorB [Bryobacterales bacterium]
MSAPVFLKGNEALLRSAILAGCRAFFGYPITPASEITEAAAYWMPLVGGVFLQAESEVAAINMVYGAAATGTRVMTASSGPGISLMQEGFSYLAGAELPCVIADITRGGPGLGNISPEQSDYFQVVKGGGHGCYRNLVLAPASVQEMADLTVLAFELADRYRNPVVVMADGCIGQMMEPVVLPKAVSEREPPSWAVMATAATRRNLITSIHLLNDDLERHNRALEAKYRRAQIEARWENWRTEDADFILMGYGIVGRVLKAVTERLRKKGVKAGLLRPITLFPFPTEEIRRLRDQVKGFLVVEMSTGQMVEDVRLAVEGVRPVEFYSRLGGNVPTAEEITDYALSMAPQSARQEERLWMAMF